MEDAQAGSWIVAVGDEILSGHTLDSNSNWLAQQLLRTPYPCSRIVVIPDREEVIVEELSRAANSPAERIFCCGGLGPTPDDRTMAALATLLRVPLTESSEAAARIRERSQQLFEQGRLPTPEPNPGTMKMAQIPSGAEVLQNPVGGAPPLAIPLEQRDGRERWLLVLPGVPRELKAVLEQVLLPRFLGGGPRLHYRELDFHGIPESRFFPLLLAMEHRFPELRFGSYPQPEAGRVLIRASGQDPDRVELAVAELSRLAPSPPLG